MAKKKYYLSFITLLIMTSIPVIKAGLFLQHEIGYISKSDDVETTAMSDMRNLTFIGAEFGKAGRWVIGQSAIFSSISFQNDSMSSITSLSLLELGPRFQYYFNQGKNIYFSFTYNFYTKGTRNITSLAQSISGSSILVSLGAQMKITRSFNFGASFHYHAVSLTESTVDTVKTTISHSYTSIYPTLSLAIRFK